MHTKLGIREGTPQHWPAGRHLSSTARATNSELLALATSTQLSRNALNHRIYATTQEAEQSSNKIKQKQKEGKAETPTETG